MNYKGYQSNSYFRVYPGTHNVKAYRLQSPTMPGKTYKAILCPACAIRANNQNMNPAVIDPRPGRNCDTCQKPYTPYMMEHEWEQAREAYIEQRAENPHNGPMEFDPLADHPGNWASYESYCNNYERLYQEYR